jgi:hypothetical protein
MSKPYSALAVAIDLLSNEYKTYDPITISDKAWEDLGMCISIHEISDYLDINRVEDFETESEKIKNKTIIEINYGK